MKSWIRFGTCSEGRRYYLQDYDVLASRFAAAAVHNALVATPGSYPPSPGLDHYHGLGFCPIRARCQVLSVHETCRSVGHVAGISWPCLAGNNI
ncbi:hypothetical protein N7474_008300 [Penicillium riverlandense]|uniref:uncharacterized protein n=1 Tax=Penicillium riverlandense TaxID=1903569 RepID=UPI00254853D6|nr:uncharacterized protein N7474_008300 [Penicillium riverlandense]KAJ5811999.1 hypothetical protein N7474_008300 [Penicillium riverlandense]